MNHLPNIPKTAPSLQLIRWITNPFGYLDSCYQEYGDVFTLRLTKGEPIVFLSHPQAIQEVFSLDAKQFDVGRNNGLIRPLVGDNSLILLDGERHQRQRKLLMPPFHGAKIQAYCQQICQITESVTSDWSIGEPISIRTTMQEITLQIIMQVVFGLKEGSRYQQLKPKLAEILDMTGSPLRSSMLFFPFLQQDWGAWSPWGKFLRLKQQINQLLQAEISDRRNHSELTGTDILTLMMSAHDEQGVGMTNEELRDELMTLLVAGHETTATALAWAFYWLHSSPSVLSKLLEELETLGDNPDPTELSRLSYLNAVCQETLRLYPVVPIASPRVTKSPLKIMDHQFDADTMLAPCIYLTHHREDLYPEPKQFKPERFLERQYSPSEFLPFGGGNRRCLGYALAMLEMKLVLAKVLSHHQLALVDDKPVKPARRGVTLSPVGGVKMIVKDKRTSQSQAKQVVLN
ncbi:MAG: cytochrome P450 [Coleofasciculaceae cyanobacterium]